MRPFELSKLISERIQALTGQEYVHRYLPTNQEEKEALLRELRSGTDENN